MELPVFGESIVFDILHLKKGVSCVEKMVKIYKVGNKSKAICHFCKDLVGTTFGYHTVPFNNGYGSVSNIMAATCDQCGSVVSIPAQSTTAIKKAYETFVPVVPLGS